MSLYVPFDYGERKHIKVKVCSCKNEPFEVKDAKWELKQNGVSEIEASGTCTIIGVEIDAFVCPKNSGLYELKITYKIADEYLVDVVSIFVGDEWE